MSQSGYVKCLPSQLSQGAFLPNSFLLITPREGKVTTLLSPHFLHQCLVLPFLGSGLFEVVPFPDLSAPPLRCSPGFCCPWFTWQLPGPPPSSCLPLYSWFLVLFLFLVFISVFRLPSFASPPCFYLYLCLVPLCSVVSQSSKSSTSLV